MIRRLASTCLVLLGTAGVAAQETPRLLRLPARGGLAIEGSERVAPGRFLRSDPAERGVLRLEGLHGVELDLDGVELVAADDPRSDRARGVAIVVRDCTDVTIRGGRAVGYAVGLLAERTTGLVVDGLTVEVTAAEALHSTVTTESDADRITRELDPDGAWPRTLGAAVRIDDCEDWVVRNVRTRHGRNGLLVSHGARGQVYDNDLSFLSGWGIALVDARGVTISRNRVDYCVRGYSEGHYANGHGSAAFVLEGDCTDIVLAENSAVRAGTGAILAGVGLGGLRAHLLDDALLSVGLGAEDAASQDDGVDPTAGPSGGSDRGRLEVRRAAPSERLDDPRATAPRARDARIWIYGNDFTGAVRGGIVLIDQADVWILGNQLEDCGRAGVRAQRFVGGIIGDNIVQGAGGSALALEDVSDCLVARNVLHKSEVGLQIWSSVDEGTDEPGAAHERSHDVWITDNSFAENDVDLGVRSTLGLRFGDNIWDPASDTIATLDISAAEGVPKSVLMNRDPETGEERPGLLRLETWLAGVGDWMPSGHVTSSSVWHPGAREHPAYGTFLAFEGFDVRGVTQPSRPQGSELGPIALGPFGPWDFESGVERPWLRLPGGALLGHDWEARWFQWSRADDPRGDLERWRALADEPLHVESVPGWPTPFGTNETIGEILGGTHFGLVAECRTELEPGRYRLTVSSDDGVRVLLDGGVVLENWSWHPMTRDSVEIDVEGGGQEWVLEYFQIEGPAVLTVDLEPLR